MPDHGVSPMPPTDPAPMMEMEPLFLSILGAPASGKSYFLTAMTWQLRRLCRLISRWTSPTPIRRRIGR